MFQNFDDEGAGERADGARTGRLREFMAERGIDGYLVPRCDEHQGEYVAAAADRLRWLTGFTGSAGLAIVLGDRAALFVDGRYVVQAPAQVDTDVYEVLEVPAAKPATWLTGALGGSGSKARIGLDARLHTIAEVARLEAALATAGAELVSLEDNLVDAIWRDRPAPSVAPVVVHPLEHAGREAGEKIATFQAVLGDGDADAQVLTLTDSIAWLFNIRGADVPHNPVVLAFAIVHRDARPELFIEPAKLGADVRAYLEGLVTLYPPGELGERLDALGRAGARVRLEPESAGYWFEMVLEGAGAVICHGPDPARIAKARKNPVEIAGSRRAHRRDGTAMARFLAWLAREAAGGGLDEIGAARKLEGFRADTGALQEISFDTISGAGAHGAIVHYRVSLATNRKLEAGTLYLVDSGGQYLDGTTDITRTIAVGTPDMEMCERFTRVLQGHIALATARFPRGTRGVDLDPFARRALWQAGLDYGHGTGHGVGSYLSVHEGPATISRRGMVALEAAMILSNEPGYYKEGAYGIRIENLVLVREAEIAGAERDMLEFETLSLAPIDRALVVADLLSDAERAWLDAYHARVLDEIGPTLDGADAEWLTAACAPIDRPG